MFLTCSLQTVSQTVSIDTYGLSSTPAGHMDSYFHTHTLVLIISRYFLRFAVFICFYLYPAPSYISCRSSLLYSSCETNASTATSDSEPPVLALSFDVCPSHLVSPLRARHARYSLVSPPPRTRKILARRRLRSHPASLPR